MMCQLALQAAAQPQPSVVDQWQGQSDNYGGGGGGYSNNRGGGGGYGERRGAVRGGHDYDREEGDFAQVR